MSRNDSGACRSTSLRAKSPPRALSLLTEVTHQGKPNSDLATLMHAGLEAGIAVGLIEPARGLDWVYRFPQAMVRHYVLELMTEHQRASDNGAVATVLVARSMRSSRCYDGEGRAAGRPGSCGFELAGQSEQG